MVHRTSGMDMTSPPCIGTLGRVAPWAELSVKVSETARTAATNLLEVTFSKYTVKAFISFSLNFGRRAWCSPAFANHYHPASGPVISLQGKTVAFHPSGHQTFSRGEKASRPCQATPEARPQQHSLPENHLGRRNRRGVVQRIGPSLQARHALQKCVGALKTKTVAEYENSNFFPVTGNSDFFSDFFPVAIALHERRGACHRKFWLRLRQRSRPASS